MRTSLALTLVTFALVTLACAGPAPVEAPPVEAPAAAPAPAPEAAPAKSTRSAAPAAPKLDLSTDYRPGAGKFELTNHSSTTYTGVRITVNGTYTYAVKRLPPQAGDNIRLGSFVSRESGQELTPKIGVKHIRVQAAEGTWEKSY